MLNRVKVAGAQTMRDGDVRLVRLGVREVALFKKGERYFALDNKCPHQGGPLGEGFIDGESVICPWHHWDFHLETGRSRLGADVCVRTYRVICEGGEVYVEG